MDKRLLILDLDETLIFGTATALRHAWDFAVGLYYVYRRPFLDEFLKAISEWFHVGVWSSASGAYVRGVVGDIFPDPATLRFVWARERCTQCFDPEYQDYYWVKNLKKVKRLGFS